jgi:hypothetical protein
MAFVSSAFEREIIPLRDLFSSIFWKFRSSSLACSAKFSWIGLGVREIFGDDRNFDPE